MLSLPNEDKNQERMWLRDDHSVWFCLFSGASFSRSRASICMYVCACNSEIGMLFELNRPLN